MTRPADRPKTSPATAQDGGAPAPGSDLLVLLDALVRRDPGPAGFAGCIAVGVRAGEATEWWQASFGARSRGESVDSPAGSVQAWVLVSAECAESILRRGRALAGRAHFDARGDVELLRRFIRRYAARASWLAIRAAPARREDERRHP